MDLSNGRRPILHKYRPEDLEIVYHRQTGDEVVSQKSLKNHATRANGSVKPRSKASVGFPAPAVQFPITHTFKTEKRKVAEENEVHPPTEFSQVASGVQKSVSDLLVDAVIFDHNQGSMLPDLEPPDEVHGMQQEFLEPRERRNNPNFEHEQLLSSCIEKLDSLAGVVVGLNENCSALEDRVRILEGTSQKLIAHNLFLLEKYSNSVKLNCSVANDMTRLRNVLNAKGNSTRKEAAELITKSRKVVQSTRKT